MRVYVVSQVIDTSPTPYDPSTEFRIVGAAMTQDAAVKIIHGRSLSLSDDGDGVQITVYDGTYKITPVDIPD